MKRCPQCGRTYSDDALSFCLDDGSPLVAAAPPSYGPSATVQYPQARETSPQPTIAFPSQAAPPLPPSPQPPAPPQWSPMPPPQKQKRSVWPWLLGIGAVLVFMGIGVIILVFAISRIAEDSNRNKNTNSNRTANRGTNKNSNSEANNNENNNSRSDLTTFTDDFSKETWGTGTSAYGNIWYQDEEYHMHANKGGYIVMYAPDKKEYYDENATVRIGARSVDGNPPATGYGLVIHGEKKDGKLEDYGFLIYNGDNPKYKIVLHRGGDETKLVDWTSTSTIRTGTLPNQLEVRIKDTKMDFYINGQFATSILDSAGYKRGRVGLYTSDVGVVAFDDLEISK